MTVVDIADTSIPFEVPLVNPAPIGLFAATTWPQDDPEIQAGGAPRFLLQDVQFRAHNYGGEAAFGVWDAGWCGDPGSAKKEGDRPDFLDAFPPMVTWGFDECDLTARSRDEVRERAQQNQRLLESIAFEREFAVRLLSDAGAASSATDLIDALGELEAAIAETGTLGFIHASAQWAAHLGSANVVFRTGTGLKTLLGNTVVFGGGYVDGLNTKLVATSPTYGWRSDVEVRDVIEAQHNEYAAVAERAVVIGYEAAIHAVTIS